MSDGELRPGILIELLDKWRRHQVMHECNHSCPSNHFYFDQYVKSQISVTDDELSEFLVGWPNVRISGRLKESPDFRSTSETDEFPVTNSYATDSLLDASTHAPLFDDPYEAVAIPQSPERGAVGHGNNQVDPSATEHAAIIRRLDSLSDRLDHMERDAAADTATILKAIWTSMMVSDGVELKGTYDWNLMVEEGRNG